MIYQFIYSEFQIYFWIFNSSRKVRSNDLALHFKIKTCQLSQNLDCCSKRKRIVRKSCNKKLIVLEVLIVREIYEISIS